MNEKKYHIDNVPASAMNIIEKAMLYSVEFSSGDFFFTSVAANILIENGHTVGELKEEQSCQ